MSVIPFPPSPSYLAYCHSPEQRDAANAMREILAGAVPDAMAARITRNILKRLDDGAR